MLKKYLLNEITANGQFDFHVNIGFLQKHAFPVHTHDFCELVIILGGSAIHQVNQWSHPVSAGHIFVLKGEDRHGFENMKNFRICNLMYRPQQILESNSELKQLRGYQALFVIEPALRKREGFKSHFTVNSKQLIATTDLVRKIEKELKSRLAGFQTLIKSYFNQLVIDLSRLYEENEHDRVEIVSPFSEVILYMENHYAEQITLADLSKIACLSPNHFLRRFNEIFECSPIQYLIRLRINKAKDLLRFSKRQISEIASETGFLDSNYFSRKFKNKEGLSPKTFRKKQELKAEI